MSTRRSRRTWRRHRRRRRPSEPQACLASALLHLCRLSRFLLLPANARDVLRGDRDIRPDQFFKHAAKLQERSGQVRKLVYWLCLGRWIVVSARLCSDCGLPQIRTLSSRLQFIAEHEDFRRVVLESEGRDSLTVEQIESVIDLTESVIRETDAALHVERVILVNPSQ